MEPYPLADAPPPRYAVESDDEDEYQPKSSPPNASDQPPEIKVDFKYIHDIPSNRPVVFASGEAGRSWAKIVNLGEQQAGIYVNGLPVGLMFCPSWTIAVVVISEAETCARLPLFAVTTYTSAIINRLQPTSVAILDSYLTHIYISHGAIFQDIAHVRYLSAGKKTADDSKLELFAPPNLLQSTTASLMNELFLYSTMEYMTQEDAAVIVLLPSSQVSPAGGFSSANWSREILEKAHKCLFAIVGVEVDELSLQGSDLRVIPLVSAGVMNYATQIQQVGEGGMYI